ncbi:hypothetical protein [Cellulomonas sp. NS3]|uniref:hypothetical protein n=1 Tax=Cellulomonas sp. NS3 TaxID=2973977 RepID=UPI0021614DD9|nr:hypothetical protein [Cellulomonas sp. NS3]
MSTDEDFARSLRDRVDLVAPDIAIDTRPVVPGARRLRRRTRAVAALAMVGLAGAAGAAAVLGLGPGSERTAPAEQGETWKPPAWFAEQERERAEYASSVGSCLEALGWNVTINPDGTFGAMRDGSQDDDPRARLDDLRRCEEDNGYTWGPKAFTDSEAREAHAKDLDSWRCMQHEGYDVEPPPPLAEYLDKGDLAGWDPFRAGDLPATRLLAICPLRWTH